jgi:hypothetical protein
MILGHRSPVVGRLSLSDGIYYTSITVMAVLPLSLPAEE